MDLRKLKTLIDLVSESNVSELEITEAEGKIRIVKGGTQTGAVGGQTHTAAPMAYVAQPAPAAAPAPGQAPCPAGRRSLRLWVPCRFCAKAPLPPFSPG